MHNVPIPVNGSKSRGWKHHFLEKSVGGCTYDVIARWPDLTQSKSFCQKLRKMVPHKLYKISARSARGSAAIPEKLMGVPLPLAWARVKEHWFCGKMWLVESTNKNHHFQVHWDTPQRIGTNMKDNWELENPKGSPIGPTILVGYSWAPWALCHRIMFEFCFNQWILAYNR